MTPTLYEQIGGEGKLREVINRFVDRMRDDLMIGFFFRNTQIDRLKELEFQHAAAFLGGPVQYTGLSLTVAHGRRSIQGGHFARRERILHEVLEEAGVDPAVGAAWLAHEESLRSQITSSPGNGCTMGPSST